MKFVIKEVALAWEKITPLTIRCSWRKLLPPETDTTDHEVSVPTQSESVENFQSLRQNLSEADIRHNRMARGR